MKTKIEAIKIIHDCAALYRNNLTGKKLLFITIRNNGVASFESLFMPRNFLHLTGVATRLNGDLFYQAAVNNRLSTSDVTLATDGKTEQKLAILPQLMSIHYTARMVGDYDNSRPLLIADKFAGTVTTAMGFINMNGIYIPNTALKLDVREITAHATRHRIAAIFIKPRDDDLYKRLTYIAKGITIDDAAISVILQEKVNMANLIADFPIPKKTIG